MEMKTNRNKKKLSIILLQKVKINLTSPKKSYNRLRKNLSMSELLVAWLK